MVPIIEKKKHPFYQPNKNRAYDGLRAGLLKIMYFDVLRLF